MGNQKATKAHCMSMICSIAKDNCDYWMPDETWCRLIRKHDNTKTYSVTIVNGAFKKLGAEHGGANPYYIGDKQYVVASILVKHSVTIGTNKGTGGKREENQKPVKFYYLTAKTEYSAKDIPALKQIYQSMWNGAKDQRMNTHETWIEVIPLLVLPKK